MTAMRSGDARRLTSHWRVRRHDDGAPQQPRSRRWLPLAVIALLGVITALIAYRLGVATDDARVRGSATFRADWRASDLQNKLHDFVAPIEAIAALLGSQQKPDAGLFHRVAELSHRPGEPLRRLSWAPRSAKPTLDHGDGDAFVVEIDQAFSGNTSLAGLDLAAEPVRRAVIDRARDGARPLATPPVPLLRSSTAGYVVFWPVYQNGVVPDTLEQRREQLSGVVEGVFGLTDSLNTGIRDTPAIIGSIYFFAGSASVGALPVAVYSPGASGVTLGASPLAAPSRDGIRIARSIDLLGQPWTLVFDFAPAVAAQMRSGTTWVPPAAVLLFTALLLAYLAREQGYRQLVEQRVADRTAALRASERRFQDIAEVSADWIWETDAEHRFTAFFGQMLDGLPMPPPLFVGKTRWEAAGADPTTDQLWAQHKADLDARRPFRHFRYEVRSPEGASLFVLASGKPVFDGDGNFAGYRGTATDETAIVEAQRRAEAAETAMRRIFENSQDLILVTDRHGVFLRVSPSAKSILGYDPDELIGRGGQEFIYQDDLDNTRNEMRKARRTGMVQNFECRYGHKDGRVVTLWWTGIWSSPEQQYFFTGRDITERRTAEERLAEARRHADETLALLETMLNSAPFGFAFIDRSYRYIRVNEAIAALHGIPAADHIGRTVAEITPDRWPELEPIYRSILESGSSGAPSQELHSSGRPGAERIVLAHHYPVRVDGDVIGIGIALIDITEQRHLEEQLVQAQKMEAVGNLTGGMAHDFNNLLGIIIGNLDLLRDHPTGDPEVSELSGEALDAALRGADLTRRLLAFARRQPLQPERAEVNKVVSDIGSLLRRTLGEQIEVSLVLGADLWPVVVDPTQLQSSIVNIATNARDAMPGGGRLVIATSNRYLDTDYASQHAEVRPGEYTLIEISDTGSGMTPEIASQIFEPFFTTKEQGQGTGLGLSMVYGFMRQSGGHINVYSELGIGTTFRLYLPRVAGEAKTGTAATEARPLLRGHGEAVLTVEDNAGLRRVAVRQLNELGYRTLEAENPQAALRLLEDERVDLLFSDIVMPGGTSGYELARTALSRWPQLKVVLTSGFPDIKVNGDAKQPGIRLLSKPYRRDDLARAIREALGNQPNKGPPDTT